MFWNGRFGETPSRDAPRVDGVVAIVAIVGLGTVVILCGLGVVGCCCSTSVVRGSLVVDCGVVGAVADKGVGVFEVDIDRDGL